MNQAKTNVQVSHKPEKSITTFTDNLQDCFLHSKDGVFTLLAILYYTILTMSYLFPLGVQFLMSRSVHSKIHYSRPSICTLCCVLAHVRGTPWGTPWGTPTCTMARFAGVRIHLRRASLCCCKTSIQVRIA